MMTLGCGWQAPDAAELTLLGEMLASQRCIQNLVKHLSCSFYCVKSVQIRSYFWSVFSCIRTEYEYLLRKSPYSVRIHGKTDQKYLRIWTLFMQWYLYRIYAISYYIIHSCGRLSVFQLSSWELDLMILIFTWIDYWTVLGTSSLLWITIL